MPKSIDYPRASLKNSLLLADAVNELGGSCSAEMAADKLNKAYRSGAYSALVGSAVKYDLLNNKKAHLEVTQLYRDIKLAYDNREVKKATQEAFLSPPLFKAIYTRFENKPLPVSHFEKLLIREFDVPNNFASRVSSYFIEGAKQTELLGEGDVLSRSADSADEVIDNEDSDTSSELDATRYTTSKPIQAKQTINAETTHPAEEDGKFSVRIKGPGMDSLIVVNEEEDLYIVRAMLKKVERRLAIDDVKDND